MNIVIVSLFRNMSTRINAYFQQVRALQDHVGPDHPVQVIAVEGDSHDDTERELGKFAELWQVPLELVKHDHGGPEFGSTEDPERLEALTGVLKAGLDAAREIAGKVDDPVVLYVESDLKWHPHQAGSVIDLAFRREDGFDVVAPMVFAGQAFYDIWGFVGRDGERFSPYAPFHRSLLRRNKTIIEVSGVGSCFALRGDALEKIRRVAGKEALRSFCKVARMAKLRIGVAPAFRIEHPA